MGGTPPDLPPGPNSPLSNEFFKAGFGPFRNPSWSDLPIDILLIILQRLELPQAIVFASVCVTWRAAATTAGVPHPSTPLIFSWGNHLQKKRVHDSCTVQPSRAVTCNLYHPVDVDKSYGVTFPKGCFDACCGASHGWLIILPKDHSSLVLYNPVTLVRITLPPATDFAFLEAFYTRGGNMEHYRRSTDELRHGACCFGIPFYKKAVLSCSPSKGSGYLVMTIHSNSECLSFLKAGQKKWQVAFLSGGDQYLDSVYHKGSFYTVTTRETVEKWDVDGEDGPTRGVVVATSARLPGCVLTRHLVSTPWGDLLQVRAGLNLWHYPDGIEFRICKVDPDAREMVVQENAVSTDHALFIGLNREMVQENAVLMDHEFFLGLNREMVLQESADLMDHALFLGLNHSACLPTKNLPGIRPRSIYFSSPGMTEDAVDYLGRLPVWGGVRRYDLETRKFERAIPVCDVSETLYGIIPSHVWITHNL